MRTSPVVAAALFVFAPGALAMPAVIAGAGHFGVGDEAFGTATVLELLDEGDTFSLNVPIHNFTESLDHPGAGARGVGSTKMWYGHYPDESSITFDVGETGISHTYGLGPHGLTYEVRDNVQVGDELRDELVIEFWPTPNTEARHGDSVFTFSVRISFDAGTWDGVDPVTDVDFSQAIETAAVLHDDEYIGIPVAAFSALGVPAPGAGALLGLVGVAQLRRRR